jgi:hypothetical protein
MSVSFDASITSFNGSPYARPCRGPRKLFGKNCLNRFKGRFGIDDFKDSFGIDGSLGVDGSLGIDGILGIDGFKDSFGIVWFTPMLFLLIEFLPFTLCLIFRLKVRPSREVHGVWK